MAARECLQGLAALVIMTSAGLAAENWRAVGGSSLAALLQGKEFGDGVHFAYRLNRDGTFTGTEMGKEVRGTWRVNNDELCWKWQPTLAEECYAVQQDGDQLRMMLNGSEAWYGTVRRLP